ncbi:hypothetical protein NLU13_1455 [Sarocladium strictum]|uniref:Bromo domain-containing protein n=1 Tax=Sarocladium strictum TaxID=5046 RepID=A0AA39GR07_SARSR|nr:hypothetical protein NLU13_1455 [Sarocladium strictum]
MDSKRKANGASSKEEDRHAKRRKIEDFDLSKGETRESTTVYGHAFLDLIRRTADKSGRHVATQFEELPPREGNSAYYKATRLPVSLRIIEEKLDKGEFRNLAEVEGYVKRMISNAKEFYPKNSTIFDDAERVRKALSNFMTKRNPAYQTRGYQAAPAPLPDDDGAEEDEEEEEDADGEPEEEEEEDEAEEEEEEEEEERRGGSKRRSIILKRRGSERHARNSISVQSQASPRVSNPNAKQDHAYENVPYRSLGFQEAQEKVVEELLRYHTPDYEDAYFEPFINLPPRALKDYYRMISEPLSLRKLQKMVKGTLSRTDTPGVSYFKTWPAFEEKAKLLWENAYYYNEEGSEIYELAQDLEKRFYKEYKAAKAAVSEPVQPKIKLKVGQAADTPGSSRKITINVGRGGTDSPAPAAADSPADGLNGVKSTVADKDRGVSETPSSIAVPKAEFGAQPGLAGVGRPGSAASGQFTPGLGRPTAQQPPAPQLNLLEPKKLRAPGKGYQDALISRLRVQTFTGPQPGDRSTALTVLPNPQEMNQSAAVNLLPHQNRVAILIQLPDFLQDRQFNLWALLDKGPLKASLQPLPGQDPNEKAFELILRPGVNVIEAHLVAAIPKEERKEGGPEIEVEVFTVLVNVLRA